VVGDYPLAIASALKGSSPQPSDRHAGAIAPGRWASQVRRARPSTSTP